MWKLPVRLVLRRVSLFCNIVKWCDVRSVTRLQYSPLSFFSPFSSLVGGGVLELQWIWSVCSLLVRSPFGLAIALHSLTHVIESGETMRAAGLHPIAIVMSTETVLITSKKCVSDDSKASFVPLIQLISSRIAGVIASRKFVLVYNIHKEKLANASMIAPGHRSPTVSRLEETDWVSVSAQVEWAEVARVMDQLQAISAVDLLVTKLDNCRM
jgi:ATP phosphoribosyltransferase-like protein